jgi:hypothetical protein
VIELRGHLLFGDAATMDDALALAPAHLPADQCRLHRDGSEVLICVDLAEAEAPVLDAFREIARRAQWSSLRIVDDEAMESIPAGRTPLEPELAAVVQAALFNGVSRGPVHRARDAQAIAELSDRLGSPIYQARLCRLLVGRPHVRRTPPARRLFDELLARPIDDDHVHAGELRTIRAEIAAAIAPRPKAPRQPRSRR